MIAKVRGNFGEFSGSFTIDGATPAATAPRPAVGPSASATTGSTTLDRYTAPGRTLSASVAVSW